VSHRITVQEARPARPSHAERGQLDEIKTRIRASQRSGTSSSWVPEPAPAKKGRTKTSTRALTHEPVAVLRCGLADRRQPVRVPVGIAEGSGGVVGVLEIAAGGPAVRSAA
jgi:hypothetical protein